MFESLKERLGIKPEEPPTDEQIVTDIDRCVRNHQFLVAAEHRSQYGNITGDELKLYQDIYGQNIHEIGRLLVKRGLLEKPDHGACLPSLEDIVKIRETLMQSEENPQNIVSMDEYRRNNGHQ